MSAAKFRLHPAASGCCPEPEGVRVLLSISPLDEDHVALRSMLPASVWHICSARCRRDAVVELNRSGISVILCEECLPDASWKDILFELDARRSSPPLVVTSRLADDLLWAEVLNLGGYDLLMKPFEAAEVVRVLDLAARQRQSAAERARSGLRIAAAG